MKPQTTPLATSITAAAIGTGTLFSLQHHAEASIVYSGPLNIVTSVPPGGGQYAHLDLNGGGNDFRIGVGVGLSTSHSAGVNIAVSGLGRQILKGFSASAIRPLAGGGVISAGAAAGWIGNGLAQPGGLLRGMGYSGVRGSWVTGQTRFAGIRLSVGGGNWDYGWIRMRIDDSNPTDGLIDTVTIFDWAYETNANTPITTPASVPEPGATALLALAGGGAAFLRRRRNS